MTQNFTSNETLKSNNQNLKFSFDFNEKRTFELVKNSLSSNLMVPKKSTIDNIMAYAKKIRD
ncbi:MAG: hypothetical protein RIR51_1626 [Bacteroidota bacterium]|jgi:hypothetical protein